MSPFIQSHSVKITRDLQQFGSEANEHRNSFLSSECLMYECDNFTAQLIIKKYNEKLLSLKVRAIDLMELQELLQSAIVNFNILKQYISYCFFVMHYGIIDLKMNLIQQTLYGNKNSKTYH